MGVLLQGEHDGAIAIAVERAPDAVRTPGVSLLVQGRLGTAVEMVDMGTLQFERLLTYWAKPTLIPENQPALLLPCYAVPRNVAP